MGIRLSEKHGVNPSVCICFFCNKNSHSLILAGRIPGDKEMPRQNVYDMVPCDECEGYMKQGIILIEVKDEADMERVEKERDDWNQGHSHLSPERMPFPGYHIPNPYRMGGWWVVKEEFVTRMFPPKLAKQVLKGRWTFILRDAAEELGLREAGEELNKSNQEKTDDEPGKNEKEG